MSDYLTRLIERSLGLAPRIGPLIAPIHAPSDQALRESAETPPAFESDRPAATTETSQQETPPGVAVNAGGAEPAPSHSESQPPPTSGPIPASQAESLVQKKDSQPQPAESRPTAPPHQTSSSPRADSLDTIAASRPDHPPTLPHAAPVVSRGTIPAAVQPEIVNPLKPAAPLQSEIILPLKPAAAPLLPAAESSPSEPPLMPRATTMAPEKTTQTIVQSEILGPFIPASPLPAPESSAAEPPPSPTTPSTATTVSKRTSQIVVQPANISPPRAAAAPRDPVRQAPSNEPPAIHISIGRIEVRAILPQTTTPKVRSPAAPKLSLEDYLKHRNGGPR